MAYGIEGFKVGDVHTFIDIGACGGTISLKALNLIAPRRIISFEPCRENFEILLNTSRNAGDAFECYNIAYGNGKDLYYMYKRAKGMRRFLANREIDWNKSKWFFTRNPTYSIEGKTLEQMFSDYDIDSNEPYVIKMDCEGCERFLLENFCDVPYIQNCLLFTAEFHFFKLDFNGTPREESVKCDEFAAWVYGNFYRTHDIIIFNRRGKAEVVSRLSELIDYFSVGKYRYIKLLKKDR